MAGFLRTLLTLSALGSVLALVLAALGPRIPSRAVYRGLWLVVLARLCLPVGAVLPLPVPAEAQAPPPAVETSAETQPADPVSPAEPVRPETTARPVQSASPGGATSPLAPQEPPAADWRAILTAPALWFALWAAGAAFCLGRAVYGYRRFARLVKAVAHPPAPEALDLLARLDPDGRAALLVCPHVPAPLLLGAVRPVIVLPEGVEADRLADILAHELTHAKHHDLPYKWLTAAVTALHWFNPVMILVRRQVGRACELACDAAVVKNLDAAGRRHYGETLLALAARPLRGAEMIAALGEEKAHLKERLVSVMGYRRPGPAALALSLALALVLTGCALIRGAEPTPSPTPTPAAAGLLEDPALYDLDHGLAAALPGDLAGQLTVLQPETGNVFLAVYETRSYETAGPEMEMGWIFSLARYDQIGFEEALTVDNSGRTFFARGDGWYYAALTPTDVRFWSEDPPEVQEAQVAVWEQLVSRLPEEVLPDFIARNGLEAFSPEDYLHDGYVWEGAHRLVHYRADDWSQSLTLLLSQPARQGEGGVWCVEGWADNQYGSLTGPVLPRGTGMTAADYYAQLQGAADRGERPELLTPEGAARAWLQAELGAAGGVITPLEGVPAWDLWGRVVKPILDSPGALTHLVYADGAETRAEEWGRAHPNATALWTWVWVEAEGPEVLNGPALVYTSEHPDTAGDRLIFPEAGGLLGIQRDGTLTWYRGAYDYAESPYELMEAEFEAWRAQQEPVGTPQDALARVFAYPYDVEFYGFKEPGSSPWTKLVPVEELPAVQAIFDSCTWEEVTERPRSSGAEGEPPFGCYTLCLTGNGQLQLEWDRPCVGFGDRYWLCTGDYDGFYARLAGLWAEKQAAGFPDTFSGAVVQEEGPLVLDYMGEARSLYHEAAVTDLVGALAWAPAEAPAEAGEGLVIRGVRPYVTATFYPGNLVYYYMDSHWNFWYQGTGETDLYPALVRLWEGAG